MGDNPPEELRLILIGKTGSGKSASGNTILGLPGHFLSKCSARSVTQVCQLGTSERKRRVVVVDLPGFGDTNLSQEQITTEVSRCVVMTAPGPHAFLLVVPLGRYTEEDNMAVTVMAAVFGEAALHNHTVVLFTRGDELEEPMEEYLASAPAHLKTLMYRCGGRYHVLNNRAPSDVEQVHKLLRKVEQVVDDNGGGCYTNAMYLEVEAARREEEDRERGERWRDGWRRRRGGSGPRPQAPPSSGGRQTPDMGDNPPEELRLILIGKTGSGKSASGNTILGLPGHFLSKCSASSITQVCQVGTSEYHVEEEVGSSSRRRRSVVVDLPGFGDTNLSLEQIITEVSRCVVLTAPGPHAFLLVVPLGRYTEEDNMAVTVMAAVFGEAALRNHTVVLFTRGDDLEEPMEEYLASAPAHLKTLIDRCGGRYHVLNNRAPSDVEQVHKLLRKVEQVVDDNGGGYMGDNPPEERRLILIGKTGSGKSASGNTILGLPGHFLSKCSASSVTQVCQEEVGRRRKRSVVVVDLPGFGDTNLSLEHIIMEVRRCVMMTAPGPHAFLLVVPLGRYTEEDNMAVTVMAAVFGEAALHNHTVVLFTRGDELEEPMEEYLASAPAHLKTLIDRCGGRYHVLNNRAPSDVEQVHKLLRKVEQVVDDNGGGCYTNAMYLEAEAASREEEDRLRREEEDRLRREKEEDRLRREEEVDSLRRRSVPGQGWRTDDDHAERGLLIGRRRLVSRQQQSALGQSERAPRHRVCLRMTSTAKIKMAAVRWSSGGL
ncbi:unnamed protein product [Merluccius merluccius]